MPTPDDPGANQSGRRFTLLSLIYEEKSKGTEAWLFEVEVSTEDKIALIPLRETPREPSTYTEKAKENDYGNRQGFLDGSWRAGSRYLMASPRQTGTIGTNSL